MKSRRRDGVGVRIRSQSNRERSCSRPAAHYIADATPREREPGGLGGAVALLEIALREGCLELVAEGDER